MNDVKIFSNSEFGEIRTVTIDNEPWFVGKDVAEALGYSEPRSAVSKKVDEADKGVAEMETPSGKQNMTVINESGLYALIFGSKLESAKRFKHWVTSEVLPAIRRHGAYMTDQTLEKAMELDLFEVKESTVNNPDGSVRINRTTKVTGKGQQYFINKLIKGVNI